MHLGKIARPLDRAKAANLNGVGFATLNCCCAQDLAQGRASQQKLIDAAAAAATRPEHSAAAEQRQDSLPAKLEQIRDSAENGTQDADSSGATDVGAQQAAGAESEMDADEQAEDSDDEELGSISSGDDSDGEEEDSAGEDDEEDADGDEQTVAAMAVGATGVAAAAGLSLHEPAEAQTQEERAGEPRFSLIFNLPARPHLTHFT